ncbi:MAG: hypothetical protein JJU19_09115, partial [Pararhodobacter sp.]|nr:hypothetical protein [Pararhodobacter sp.]
MFYNLFPLSEKSRPPLHGLEEEVPALGLRYPGAALLQDGGLIMVWEQQRDPENAALFDVLAQRYGPDGEPIGDILTLFQHQNANNALIEPHVVGLAGGGFAVLLEGRRLVMFDDAGEQSSQTTITLPDRSLTGLGGATYDLALSPASSITDFKVAAGGQIKSYGLRTLTALDDGGVAVTVNAAHPGMMDRYPRGETIFTQTFDAEGRSEGPPQQITPWMDAAPIFFGQMAYGRPFMDRVDASTTLPDGQYALLLRIGTEHPDNRGDDPETPGTSPRIMLLIVNRDGSAASDLIAVADAPDGMRERPDIATLADGSMVVAWRSPAEVRWQRFDADGAAMAEPVVIAGSFAMPQVQPMPDGGFLLTLGFRLDGFGIRTEEISWAQRYDSEGAPVGPLFPFQRVDPFGDNNFFEQIVLPLPDGGPLFSLWRGYNFDDEAPHGDVAIQLFLPEVLGTAGDDVLQAFPTATALFGLAGDDRLISGPGNDLMFGGDGVNTAVFSGALADYAIETDPQTGITTVTDLRDPAETFNHTGTDQLRGIAFAEFADQGVSLAPQVDVGIAVADLTGALMAGVEVSFTPQDGSAGVEATTGADGVAIFGLEPGSAGRLEAARAYDPQAGDPVITAGDALDVLRMAVGLNPSFGPAQAQNFIAADMNGDGQVTAADALEIL